MRRKIVKTSIVIATYNKLDYTKQCIESIREYTANGTYEIVVVDNRSSDGSVEWLRGQPDIRTITNEENLGFPKACNQGIEVATGDNILLLNNDTIVTSRWLDNMLACLYSSDSIGAVSSVTNYCSYYQTIAVHYNTIQEMQAFAANYNRSDPSQWEERLKLIGFNMLIKRSMVETIGLLDERFTPGNFEDDDYSWRIRQAGYRLMLCKDTFIHHFGSTSFKEQNRKYQELLQTNRRKFMEKWNFDPVRQTEIRHDIVGLIRKSIHAPISVLEVGCGAGGTLLKIKDTYRNAVLYGVERELPAAESAAIFADILVGELESVPFDFPVQSFDVIILNRTLHTLAQPAATLQSLRRFLKKDGLLIAVVPNLLHYVVVHGLLNGSVSRDQLSYLKWSEANELFSAAGFADVEVTGITQQRAEQDEQFLYAITSLSAAGVSQPFEMTEFIVRAGNQTKSSLIVDALHRLESQTELDSALNVLMAQDAEQVIGEIESKSVDPVVTLNVIALAYFEQKASTDDVLAFLKKAFELDNSNPNTLFNLGFVMYATGRSELALEWFELIPEKSEQVVRWIEQIRQELYQSKYDKHRLKFALRRIENDIDTGDSLDEIVELLAEGQTPPEQLLATIENDIVYKVKTLNRVAVACYEYRLQDFIFPLLEKSVALEPNNLETQYEIGRILYLIGDYENALPYLERIESSDEHVQQLLADIREVIS